MMPTSLEALLIASFFVVPGYVGILAFGHYVLRQRRETPRLLVEAVAVSMVFWLFAAAPVYWAIEAKAFEARPLLSVGAVSASALLAPAGAGAALGWCVKHGKIGGFRILAPKAWDFRFSGRDAALVRVTLADGARVGGLWASESCASVYPEPEDLFLEALFELDGEGQFVALIPGTRGAWIPGSSIKLLEFLEVEEEDENVRTEEGIAHRDPEGRRVSGDAEGQPGGGEAATESDGRGPGHAEPGPTGTAGLEPQRHEKEVIPRTLGVPAAAPETGESNADTQQTPPA